MFVKAIPVVGLFMLFDLVIPSTSSKLCTSMQRYAVAKMCGKKYPLVGQAMPNMLECVRMCNRLPLPQKMQQYAKEEKSIEKKKKHWCYKNYTKKKHNNYFY